MSFVTRVRFELGHPCPQAWGANPGGSNVLIFEEIDSYKIVYSGFRLRSKNALM
jgi:hypothetical protein